MSIDQVATGVDAYYQRRDNGTYLPTKHAQGAWVDHEQHMAPVAGLIMHALEEFEPRDDLQLSKITFDILGQIPLAETSVEVEIVRPGKTIELMQATLTAGGRPVVRATAWRLIRVDTSPVAGGFPDPLPPPEDSKVWQGTSLWTGGFIESLEFRVIEGSRPGHTRAWIRTPYPIVAEHPSSPTAQFLMLTDTANGIATRVHPREWMFPNTDLTIHLYRTPEGEWVGYDTSVVFGPSGVGLTSTVLYDRLGAVGRTQQILTVRPHPSAG